MSQYKTHWDNNNLNNHFLQGDRAIVKTIFDTMTVIPRSSLYSVFSHLYLNNKFWECVPPFSPAPSYLQPAPYDRQHTHSPSYPQKSIRASPQFPTVRNIPVYTSTNRIVPGLKSYFSFPSPIYMHVHIAWGLWLLPFSSTGGDWAGRGWDLTWLYWHPWTILVYTLSTESMDAPSLFLNMIHASLVWSVSIFTEGSIRVRLQKSFLNLAGLTLSIHKDRQSAPPLGEEL